MYVQRDVLSGTLEGKHDFRRRTPRTSNEVHALARRARTSPTAAVTYDRWVWDDGNGPAEHWLLGSNELREFGALRDDGWGTTLAAQLPIAFGRFGRASSPPASIARRSSAAITIAGSTCANENANVESPPESLFAGGQFDSTSSGGWAEETTLDIDNYRADQRVEAGWLSLDVPFGPAVKAYVGVRLSTACRTRTYDLFNRRASARGHLDDVDVLPTVNVSWNATNRSA